MKVSISWAVLQSHILFDDIRAKKFMGHTVLTAALITFVLTNRVDPSMLTALEEKAEAARKEVKILEPKVKKCEELQAAVKQDIGNHKKDCKEEFRKIKVKVQY